jgi:branched-chain amino acid transport system permease protein
MEQLSLARVTLILLLGAMAAALVLIVPPAYLPGVTRTVALAGAAMSLNLLIGNVGLISIGHGLFVGLGAYCVAIANLKFGYSIWVGIAAGIAASAIVSAAVAAISLRARHLFFALLTLAIGQVAFVFVTRNYEWTGGDDGLVGIRVPAWLESDVAQHLFAVSVTTAIVLLILAILSSPFGTTLRAVRDNRERVASLGVNPKVVEFAAMVIAGILGTISGTLFAVTDQYVGPTILTWVVSATLLVMVALGGRSMFFGPIIGVAVLETIRNFLHGATEYSNMIVGAIIILCAIAFPEGIGRVATMLTRNRSNAT